MKNHVRKLGILLSLSLILVLSSETVCGQKSGVEKTLSLTDSLPKPIQPPKRIVYQQERGVFLNELQEQVTLEKLLWKEQYRQDAVSMYWVNKALEERMNEVIAINQKLRTDLATAETSSIRATANMEHYRGLYKEMEAENIKLRNANRNLEAGNFILKIGVVGLGASTVYFGVIKPLISR